jgi:hypothetical protein
MSHELPEWMNFEYISICLKSDINIDDILDVFREINNIEFPSELNNRISDIDENNVTESSIAVSDTPPRKSLDKDVNLIFFEIEKSNEESYQIHIHIDFEWRLSDDIEKIVSSVLQIVGEADVEMFRIDAELDYPLSELNIPIKKESAEKVVGIRLKSDGSTYIIQEGEPDTKTDIRHTQSEPYIISPDMSNIIHTKTLSVLEYVDTLAS